MSHFFQQFNYNHFRTQYLGNSISTFPSNSKWEVIGQELLLKVDGPKGVKTDGPNQNEQILNVTDYRNWPVL